MVQKDDGLILSHWKDDRVVTIPKNVADLMKNCHVDGVRFLYGCYRKKLQGAILNQDVGMNNELQIAALLNAISSVNINKNPILIISAEENIISWHYHIRKYSGIDLFRLNEHNSDHLLEKNDLFVLLATEKDFKVLQEWKNVDFFMVVVDQLELMVKKRIFNHLVGDFNIGLTDRNFFKNRDQKLLWNMLNWANPGMFGKVGQFEKFDTAHLDCLANPYSDVWLRQTWTGSNSTDKPTPEERKEYLDKIKDWAKDCDLIPSSNPTKPTRKRKANSNISNKTKKQSVADDDNQPTDEEYVEPLSSLESPPRMPNSWDSDYDSTDEQSPVNTIKKSPINKMKLKKSSPIKTSPKKNLFGSPTKIICSSQRTLRNGWYIRKQNLIDDDDDFWVNRNLPKKSKSEIDDLIRRDFSMLENDLNHSISENNKANGSILNNIDKLFNGEEITRAEQSNKKNQSILSILFEPIEKNAKNVGTSQVAGPSDAVLSEINNSSRVLKTKYKSDIGAATKCDFIDDYVINEFNKEFLQETKKTSSLKTRSKSDTCLLKEHIDEHFLKEFSKDFCMEDDLIIEETQDLILTKSLDIDDNLLESTKIDDLIIDESEELVPTETIEILDDDSLESTKEDNAALSTNDDNATLLEIINGSSNNLSDSSATSQKQEDCGSDDDFLKRLVFSDQPSRLKSTKVKSAVYVTADDFSSDDDLLTSFICDKRSSNKSDVFDGLLTGKILTPE